MGTVRSPSNESANVPHSGWMPSTAPLSADVYWLSAGDEPPVRPLTETESSGTSPGASSKSTYTLSPLHAVVPAERTLTVEPTAFEICVAIVVRSSPKPTL